MAKGKVKKIANLDAKFGAAGEYWFVKVQAPWSHDAEEYWQCSQGPQAKLVRAGWRCGLISPDMAFADQGSTETMNQRYMGQLNLAQQKFNFL